MVFKTAALALLCISSALALPVRREVPQEHSHEQFLTSVRNSLNKNNPDGITDPVFGLLGDDAAKGGAGKIKDVTCLQQATADQAFTNAKAAKDVKGMVDALIYRALERNSGKVGQTTNKCTSIKAKNPEIAAIQQHQDPASNNAKAVNKEIALELARQIKKVGGNPQDALKSGTFAPGNLNDNSGKGNTCDETNDPVGCIFTQNKLVNDATAAEIDAAVGGGGGNNNNNNNADCPPDVTVTVTVPPAGATPAAGGNNGNNNNNNNGGGNGNQQKFTDGLGNQKAPAVTKGGRGFVVEGNDFVNLAAAVGRSCDIQKNKCADFANSNAGRSAGITVGQCDQQTAKCRSANGV